MQYETQESGVVDTGEWCSRDTGESGVVETLESGVEPTFGSMSIACSLRKVQRKSARFWMKFCSSS